MYLTIEHQVGGKSMGARPEDLSYISDYSWESPTHMKEAVKIMLTACLDGDDDFPRSRFDSVLTDEQRQVRLKLADNPLTSEAVLDYLRKTGDSKVCELVAQNPRSSEATLTALSNHPDPEVRAALSENPHCPASIIDHLSRDRHPDVRLRLAENSRLLLSVLERLTVDENPFVAAQAQETMQRLTVKTAFKAELPSFVPAPFFMMLAT